MIRVIYKSVCDVVSDSPEFFPMLANILSESLNNNIQWGVTGVLAFHEGAFLQILEGPDAAVDSLFCRIRNDLRHRDVVVLAVASTSVRRFPISSMAYVGVSSEAAPIFRLLDRPTDLHEALGAALVDALAESVSSQSQTLKPDTELGHRQVYGLDSTRVR